MKALSTKTCDRLWVGGQVILIGLLVLAAFLGQHWPSRDLLFVVGLLVFLAGGLEMLWGGVTLGRSLTPFPSPRGESHYEHGPYRFVRHPMYGGGVVLAVGVALASSPVALAPAMALVPFFILKSRYEERLLVRADPSYEEYLGRVRARLVPWIL